MAWALVMLVQLFCVTESIWQRMGLIVVVTIDQESGVVIAGPDIVSRGFIYVREAEDLMEELRIQSQITLDRCQDLKVYGIGMALKVHSRAR